MTSCPVTLRWATPSDAAAVGALFTSHLQALRATPDPDLDQDMADFPRAYEAPGARFVVAVSPEGEIVGMAGFRNGEVRRVHVKSPWRGRGIAGQMILRLMRAGGLPEKEPVRAVVAVANTAACRVFERCGFLPTDRKPDDPRMSHCEVFERAAPLRPGPPAAANRGCPC